MRNKIVVYTAVFGNYSGLIPQPKFKNIDYICYTDQDLKAKNWTIIKVKPPIEDDNTRSNRYYKILTHKHISKDYEVSVYIDANFWILKDFTSLVHEKMRISKIAFFDHNQNNGDARNCIYEEYEAILEIANKKNIFRDDPEIMKKQIEQFKKEDYPKNNGLISGGVIIRKHFDNEVIKLMEAWWEMVLNQSKRDQLSFNYIVWKLDFKNLSYINGDIRSGNPWFYLISHRKKYAFKMFKIKFKKFFKPKNN